MDDFIKVIRKKVVDLTGINAKKDLQIEGVDFDNSNKSEWVSEFITGGEFSDFTNQKISASGYIVEYMFCSKQGTGIAKILAKANLCAENFAGMTILTEHNKIDIENVKVKSSISEKFNTVSMILTLFIQTR
jgi:hypothetical protein